MDVEERLRVYDEVSAIYDAISELTKAEANTLDTTVLDRAAAFFSGQVMTIEEPEITTSGNCGAVGNEQNVTWALTVNNDDNENPTYILTISGEGALADDDNNGEKAL